MPRLAKLNLQTEGGKRLLEEYYRRDTIYLSGWHHLTPDNGPLKVCPKQRSKAIDAQAIIVIGEI
eukprot:scaffold1712_cov126-Cylindrotheca_fusiformis.AAC.1